MQTGQTGHERSGSGNTITEPEKKQCNKSQRWCFTWNNYQVTDYDNLILYFKEKGFLYIVGKETATTGTPHLQGYIEKKKRFRPSELKLNKAIHWEYARGTRDDNIKYCSKENKFDTNFIIDRSLNIIEEDKFYPYQKWLLNELKKTPDDRTIYWIWDEKGKIGKSAFAKHMAVRYNCICVGGKANDIFCGINKYKESKGYYPDIIIVDCPRDKIDYMNYGALEQVKNGLVFSGKYESNMMVFASPHVVVFANSKPDVFKFSADRWVIKKIKDKLEDSVDFAV